MANHRRFVGNRRLTPLLIGMYYGEGKPSTDDLYEAFCGEISTLKSEVLVTPEKIKVEMVLAELYRQEYAVIRVKMAVLCVTKLDRKLMDG